MRLIDADALMEYRFKNPISYNAFCGLIKRMPTIYAVEVVRCKDCKHWGTIRCGHWDGYWKTEKNWFCADGERRLEACHDDCNRCRYCPDGERRTDEID